MTSKHSHKQIHMWKRRACMTLANFGQKLYQKWQQPRRFNSCIHGSRSAFDLFYTMRFFLIARYPRLAQLGRERLILGILKLTARQTSSDPKGTRTDYPVNTKPGSFLFSCAFHDLLRSDTIWPLLLNIACWRSEQWHAQWGTGDQDGKEDS